MLWSIYFACTSALRLGDMRFVQTSWGCPAALGKHNRRQFETQQASAGFSGSTLLQIQTQHVLLHPETQTSHEGTTRPFSSFGWLALGGLAAGFCSPLSCICSPVPFGYGLHPHSTSPHLISAV